MNGHISLAIAIVSEVVATSALKASDGFTKMIPSALVVLGYAVAFYFLSIALKSVPIGIAYATWAGLGMVLVAMVGYFIYQEKLDLYGVIGLVLILSGVFFLNVLSKSGAH